MSKIRVIMDAHGGDKAPLEALRGARQAVDELDVVVTLCGNEPSLRELCAKESISTDGIVFVHTESIIPVEAQPTAIMKEYKDCSMAVGLRLLTEDKGDAFVTAGSTGAAVVGATMIVGRIKGIKRPAIATVIPTTGGGCYMLMDGGANAECRPEMLVQFGVMGSAYMQRLIGVDNPRVGLVNIGAEETKGNELQVQAYRQLAESPLNFAGNIEARGLPLGECDVAVTDGFTGNIILKLTEGMGKMLMAELKGMLLAGTRTKIAAGLLKGALGDFRRQLDYTEYGGAPLMGIARPVIKAHGSSNAKAFKNAVRQAKIMCEERIIEQIRLTVSQM